MPHVSIRRSPTSVPFYEDARLGTHIDIRMLVFLVEDSTSLSVLHLINVERRANIVNFRANFTRISRAACPL